MLFTRCIVLLIPLEINHLLKKKKRKEKKHLGHGLALTFCLGNSGYCSTYFLLGIVFFELELCQTEA